MNIKITYNWLLEYLDTDASPDDLQKYLSLCGPSVERVEKKGNDYVFDIEITANRVDTASVIGIAREAQAILPQFGVPARLKKNPLQELTSKQVRCETDRPLTAQIKILNSKLASRISAVVLSNVDVASSPSLIKQRLEDCDIRSINNVVDISNYLRVTLGQPVHIFDYDSIAGHELIIQSSKKGETITTLDGKKIKLPGGDIIIKSGDGTIIDLAGLMGGQNTEVKNTTKNIILFVPCFNKQMIRRTFMSTGQRTDSATYFEKGLDPESVEPTLVYGTQLLQQMAGARRAEPLGGAKVASPIYDLYPKRVHSKKVTVSIEQINQLIGIEIKKSQAIDIMQSLGFDVKTKSKTGLEISVPSYRAADIEIWQDVAEEIARVYGYHRLPAILQNTVSPVQPKREESLFLTENRVINYLKDIGLNNVINYSMIAKSQIESLGLKTKDHLQLANTISEKIEYMRTCLAPSLITNIVENIGRKNPLSFFEIANVYLPKKSDLPDEVRKLGIAVNTDFFDLKGIIESLFADLHITDYSFEADSNTSYLDQNIQAKIFIGDQPIGYIGRLAYQYEQNFGLKTPVFLSEIDFEMIANSARAIGNYKPINPYAVIKLDWTLEKKNAPYAEIVEKIKSVSRLLQSVEFVSQYENKLTFRLYFSSVDRNLTEKEALLELDKIKKMI